MRLKSFEVIIQIKVYNKKVIFQGREVLKDFYEMKEYIFSILSIACVCAIDKAKEYLEDNYRGQYIDYVKIEAFEEPVITIFQKDIKV